MGGYGSGPQDYKHSTSGAKRVDIRYLRKNGWLRPGNASVLYWTRGGELSGHIRYSIFKGGLVLDYKVRENDGEWQEMKYSVPLEAIPCRYGGMREYFRCPNTHCNRRCEVLYSTGAYFLCRKCCGYLYPSQKGDKLDKLRWAKEQIGERIFEDWNGSEGWRKKKGMHWKTFERDLTQYRDLEAQWNRAYLQKAAQLGVVL